VIELLIVQTITTLALAAFVIKLRRELWPMIAGAGSEEIGFWVRSSSVLLIITPQIRAAKTVIKVRWLFTEEIHLIHSLEISDVAMEPTSRVFYTMWKEWMMGSDKYRCKVEKPRGLARLYTKAIDVVCFEQKDAEQKEVKWVPMPTKYRKRRRRRASRHFSNQRRD